MNDLAIRNKIRSQIRPYSDVPRYPTGWGGKLTFDEIAKTLSPLMAAKLGRFGHYDQDVPDYIQTGLMRLWLRLVEEPNLLAKDGLYQSMWRTLAISKHTTILKRNKKFVMFTDMEGGAKLDVDEYGISGYSAPMTGYKSNERWAWWTAAVDSRLDITEALHAVAQEYADDIRGLVGLYILTTQVEARAALAAHNLATSMVYARMRGIRYRLQRLLKEYEPIKPRTWKERYDAGEVTPYLEVLALYKDKPLAMKALETLTTDAKIRHITNNERDRKMVMYYRKKCLKKIEAAYGQAASF